MYVTWSPKFAGFYFRDVYKLLFARRYVTARILAEESLTGQEVVFAVTTVCLVLRNVIVVQKENLSRTENSNAQAAVARLPSSAFDRHQAAAAESREEIGVRNAAETMFMIAWAMFINLKFLCELRTMDKFLCNWCRSCNSFVQPVLQS